MGIRDWKWTYAGVQPTTVLVALMAGIKGARSGHLGHKWQASTAREAAKVAGGGNQETVFTRKNKAWVLGVCKNLKKKNGV